MGFQTAIDGPAGAGKSTIAKRAAAALQFVYVDTGAMYRSIGLYFLKNQIDISDEAACEAVLPEITVDIAYENGLQQVYLNGENVSGQIRTQEVGEAASKTSAYKAVRAKLLNLQRDLAERCDVLMDGRDIGTAVLPKANLKIYLTADSAVRAKRRYDELTAKGEYCDLQAIKQEIEERDYRDMHRDIAPLKKADDAVVIDSSYMTIEEVTDRILELVKERQ